jgi:hypothetical protein
LESATSAGLPRVLASDETGVDLNTTIENTQSTAAIVKTSATHPSFHPLPFEIPASSSVAGTESKRADMRLAAKKRGDAKGRAV